MFEGATAVNKDEIEVLTTRINDESLTPRDRVNAIRKRAFTYRSYAQKASDFTEKVDWYSRAIKDLEGCTRLYPGITADHFRKTNSFPECSWAVPAYEHIVASGEIFRDNAGQEIMKSIYSMRADAIPHLHLLEPVSYTHLTLPTKA